MIPKIIHYCWFGHNPLPKSALKCINSWKKFFPDYEIWQWSEVSFYENGNQDKNCIADKLMPFDVNIVPYTQEAYEAKKYAFVSDYARFLILYNYGGVYFDTDVQVIKSFDDIIAHGAFMGREAGAYMSKYGLHNGLAVAPGLALGVEAGNNIYKEFLDAYDGVAFKLEDGTLNTATVVEYATRILIKEGLSDKNNEIENIGGISIYPSDYFCPMDHTRGNTINITNNTVSIHLYDCSWLDHNTPSYRLHQIKNKLMQLFGVEFVSKVADFIKRR